MKNHTRKVAFIAAALGVGLYWGCGETPKALAPPPVTVTQDRLPQDVKVSCTITDSLFKTWFADGKVMENGRVLPANSVLFPHANNCSFYQWSEQMFLWITSPVSGNKYSEGNSIIESPLFYDVAGVNGKKFHLVAHKPGEPLHADGHIEQEGPNQLPLIIDKDNKLYEVELHSAAANDKAMIKNDAGKPVEVASVQDGANGTHIFKDRTGKVIAHPKAVVTHTVNPDRIVEEFKIGNERVYLDTAGNEVNAVLGQATGNVLMAQNGSLVYYILMVNDVYAEFLTAAKRNKMSGFQFPTTDSARDSICTIARRDSVTLPDSNALAIELKSAWVEAKNLPDISSYFTIDAMIPTYDTSNPCRWVPNGERKAKLALIGIHVVGSLANHPEMSWATFEHQNNAPNAAYAYIDSNNKKKIVPQETGGGWLLSGNGADPHPNIPHMDNGGDTVICDSPYTISASNTLMALPWGSAMDSATNPEDSSSAASNSEVIAINNAVRHMLMGSDVRKNYLLIGATWTNNGVAPNGHCYSASNNDPGVAIGTSVLANATMETYFQKPKYSCFFCHSHKNSLAPDALSHIYGKLEPLPVQLRKKIK